MRKLVVTTGGVPVEVVVLEVQDVDNVVDVEDV